MKTIFVPAVVLSVAFLVSSCGTGTYTSQNVSGGALLGATAGAVIGHQSGRALEGAALGGIAGGLAGHALTPQGPSYQNVGYQNSNYGPASYQNECYGYQEGPVEYRNSYDDQRGYAPVYDRESIEAYPRYDNRGQAYQGQPFYGY